MRIYISRVKALVTVLDKYSLFLKHQFLDDLIPQGLCRAVGYTLLNYIAGEEDRQVFYLWLINRL